jgi:hypothetical protein
MVLDPRLRTLYESLYTKYERVAKYPRAYRLGARTSLLELMPWIPNTEKELFSIIEKRDGMNILELSLYELGYELSK